MARRKTSTHTEITRWLSPVDVQCDKNACRGNECGSIPLGGWICVLYGFAGLEDGLDSLKPIRDRLDELLLQNLVRCRSIVKGTRM